MQSVREIFEAAYGDSAGTIPQETFFFSQKNNDGVEKHYSITPKDYEKALANKFGNFDSFSERFTKHLLGQKNIIAAFASTPLSFSNAWNMKAEELSAEDALALSRTGGHFQFNQLANGSDKSGSALYQRGFPKGLVHSKGAGLTKGFRHRTGGIYEEDSLNEMGVFKYATPTDAAGMIEYRFAECFSHRLGVPLVYIITQWFKYDTEFEPLNDWIYMTGVARVVSRKGHPYDSIELQLINKDDALKIIDNLLDAIQTSGDYQIRPPMPEHLRLGWSFDKISRDRKKRDLIIGYATANNMRCPGSLCGHIPFKKLHSKGIHIGHRISQKWNSRNSGVADVHHPYNLYLTCGKCNTSLGEKYPTDIDKLIEDLGTIGDWLMKDLLTREPKEARDQE